MLDFISLFVSLSMQYILLYLFVMSFTYLCHLKATTTLAQRPLELEVTNPRGPSGARLAQPEHCPHALPTLSLRSRWCSKQTAGP